MINNPNSAIQRIKNHLSYKLGQELIAFDTGGGGVSSLLFKLYLIKKTHKNILKFINKSQKSSQNLDAYL
ncbi:hypothetical protein [Campylobacter helveticus]|uniref:hypothetical protein n=1 Tax=Campylobacter helveticus TaxID=28898 RepID=UPI0022EB7BD2|nr:hypothetical protein [Campylobacter helveticus]